MHGVYYLQNCDGGTEQRDGTTVPVPTRVRTGGRQSERHEPQNCAGKTAHRFNVGHPAKIEARVVIRTGHRSGPTKQETAIRPIINHIHLNLRQSLKWRFNCYSCAFGLEAETLCLLATPNRDAVCGRDAVCAAPSWRFPASDTALRFNRRQSRNF